MKNFFFLYLIFTSVLVGQESNDKIVYLDSLDRETSKENHVFYRVVKDYYLNLPEYQIKEYYKSGALKTEGLSLTRERNAYKSEWISYHENGNKKSTINYEKGRPNGRIEQWHENGNKRMIGEYTISNYDDLVYELKIQQFWDSNNVQKVIDGNGEYEEIEPHSISTGKVKNGYKEGEWRGRNPIAKYTFVEFYENRNLVSGKSIDSLNTEYNYTKVFLPPRPKKGIEHFYKYIAKKFRIPKKHGYIDGKIILDFVIDKDGSITNVRILKGMNEEYNNEAIRLISEYPDWGSGELRGIKIKTSYSIPITFRSDE
ncbi:MAG: energy transducer TonB [Flavobacteriales bacterium]|nr:energy transducer TonB [Flavobacteriales bacterium]